jgi:hypothetical protein
VDPYLADGTEGYGVTAQKLPSAIQMGQGEYTPLGE